MNLAQQRLNLQQQSVANADADLQRRIDLAREACAAAGVNPNDAPFDFDDERLVITSARRAPAKPD